MIEVFGRATSGNVQIVMWAAAELGLEIKRHDLGHSHGGLDTPEFMAMNPNGLIPVIRDHETGATLWEAAAILRYLGALYGDGDFWPLDPGRRGELDMWAEWCKWTFTPAFNLKIFWQAVRTAADQRDLAAEALAIEALKPLARMLDARIGDGPYLSGARLSFADIMAGHQLYRYYTLDFDRAETPALDAYYALLKEREPFAEHVCVSYEPLRVR